jgi:hypothetical protein
LRNESRHRATLLIGAVTAERKGYEYRPLFAMILLVPQQGVPPKQHPCPGCSSTSGTIKRMDLPEHWQPSSDERILAWVGTLATLTAAALWVRNARTRAQRLRELQ